MATIKRFEDIQAWQEARELTNFIYNVLKKSKDYSFNDQMQRASLSIMNNIAEGFERQTDKELKQFLFIAKGSAGEVRSMAILGKDLGYFSEEDFSYLHAKTTKISVLIAGFIKVL